MSPAPRITPFTLADVPEIAALLQAARPDYIRHFHPFPFTEAGISGQLQAVRKDRWWGLRDNENTLEGFFLLRGFDQGYARPTFGLFVAESRSRRGSGRAALTYALDWCRASAVGAMLLKVHPENEYALRIYRKAGLEPVGTCPTTGLLMMEWRSSIPSQPQPVPNE